MKPFKKDLNSLLDSARRQVDILQGKDPDVEALKRQATALGNRVANVTEKTADAAFNAVTNFADQVQERAANAAAAARKIASDQRSKEREKERDRIRNKYDLQK